jgi:hypothetical protein
VAVGLASSLSWDAVRYSDGTFVARTADLVAIGENRATLFRIALLADMLSSYLLFVPIALYLAARHEHVPIAIWPAWLGALLWTDR